jgi:pilus assembly protein CpaF
MLNSNGTVWVIPRGSSQPELVAEVQPSATDALLVISRILANANRRATEAEPEVSAKLPRSARFPTGARVHVIIPPIANGTHPALNIRFYETEPVRPETLLAWGALSKELFEFLTQAIRQHLCIMIADGTGTGKTTLLSALGNFIPREDRILLKDPVEIVLDHPHVVLLESRPPSIEGKYEVTMSSLVNAAMRMTPKWLIVGEVRHGSAGASLFSAQMSDHPGLSTIHASTPRAALNRLALLMHLQGNLATCEVEADVSELFQVHWARHDPRDRDRRNAFYVGWPYRAVAVRLRWEAWRFVHACQGSRAPCAPPGGGARPWESSSGTFDKPDILTLHGSRTGLR